MMTSPRTLAITLNACLLIGGSAIALLWNAGRADQPAPSPTGGGGGVQLEPLPAKQQPRRTRAIFVCRRAAPVIFSDHPCGQSAEERAVEIREPPVGRAASTAPAPAAAATRPRAQPAPADAEPGAADRRCRQLRDQLDRLDDRMRSGYSAREAGKLWNRWRELNSAIYSERC